VLRASQPANAAVNPVSKLKFVAGLAADPQRLAKRGKRELQKVFRQTFSFEKLN
jgi:hypothetical protein